MSEPYRWTDDDPSGATAPGATILSSFPTAGLAATIAAHYVITSLNLPRIGILESLDAPPVAIVQGGEVQPPVRFHGRTDLGVVLSEFPPTVSAVGPLAAGILDGAERRKARWVVCLEGVVPHPVEDEGDSDGSEPSVWWVASRSDEELQRAVDRSGARPLGDGVIGGVSGALLVGGLRRPVPVLVLLVRARESAGFPDHRAGAALIETLDKILPQLKIDTGPLRSQAETIERALRAVMKGRAPTHPGATPDLSGSGGSGMYQ
ncbi:MAG: PAC2 family protein [Thermoplasmata archaeon]|nr:PAC2 family protein [Thermoplasmata archaeon]